MAKKFIPLALILTLLGCAHYEEPVDSEESYVIEAPKKEPRAYKKYNDNPTTDAYND